MRFRKSRRRCAAKPPAQSPCPRLRLCSPAQAPVPAVCARPSPGAPPRCFAMQDTALRHGRGGTRRLLLLLRPNESLRSKRWAAAEADPSLRQLPAEATPAARPRRHPSCPGAHAVLAPCLPGRRRRRCRPLSRFAGHPDCRADGAVVAANEADIDFQYAALDVPALTAEAAFTLSGDEHWRWELAAVAAAGHDGKFADKQVTGCSPTGTWIRAGTTGYEPALLLRRPIPSY